MNIEGMNINNGGWASSPVEVVQNIFCRSDREDERSA
jgi:hypothetical protein